MSYLRAPDGMCYNIHGHDGSNGAEREPHCHVTCQGARVSVSLTTGRIIVGESQLDRNKAKQIEEWVCNNMYELMQEWNEKLSDSERYK